jgi:hypothetical protein
LVRTVKQATEERQARTELLDHVHVTAARKLQRLVSSCKALQKEIDQRESLRFVRAYYVCFNFCGHSALICAYML